MPEWRRPALGPELEEVARTMRGAIAGLRAAAETLESFPDLDGEPRARLTAVVAQESERLGELVRRLEALALTATLAAGRAPGATTTTVGELVAKLAAAAEQLGFERVAEPVVGAALAGAVLEVPGEEVVAAAATLLAELRREMAVSRLRLGVRRVDRHLLLDLGWNPDPADLPRLLEWPGAALDAPAAGARGGALRGLRPLARGHDGEAWFILDRDGSAAHVKVLLPLAEVTAPAPS
jgi:DNA polymerase-3 subunit epsilon